MKQADTNPWKRFTSEALRLDGETNLKFPFKTLTKKYGIAYIDYLKASYQCWEEETEINGRTLEDWCRREHCPIGFVPTLKSKIALNKVLTK